MKLNGTSFALAGAVFLAIVFAASLVADRLGIAGGQAIVNGLEKIYGSVGLQRDWLGLLMSLIWGFVTGFVAIGLFGVLYNSMVGKKE